jgi:hypothetical protein
VDETARVELGVSLTQEQPVGNPPLEPTGGQLLREAAIDVSAERTSEARVQNSFGLQGERIYRMFTKQFWGRKGTIFFLSKCKYIL